MASSYNVMDLDEKGLLKNPPSLEIIKWMDHTASSVPGWKDHATANNISPSAVFTVGWVVKETPDYIITVATTEKNIDGQVQGEMCILKKVIEYRWVLRDPTTPRKR